MSGLAVLGTTLLVRALLGNPGNSQVLTAISEGLLIVGWVAMWRPIEVLLFERVENHQNMALFDRAASNLKCNTLTKGNVRKWERDTSTCSQKTE